MPAGPESALFALADPTRRAIFEELARGGERNVRSLTDRAGVSQPAVSKHLAVLTRAGLTRSRRDGRQTFYSAQPSGLRPVVHWLGFYAAFWADRVARLEKLLESLDA